MFTYYYLSCYWHLILNFFLSLHKSNLLSSLCSDSPAPKVHRLRLERKKRQVFPLHSPVIFIIKLLNKCYFFNPSLSRELFYPLVSLSLFLYFLVYFLSPDQSFSWSLWHNIFHIRQERICVTFLTTSCLDFWCLFVLFDSWMKIIACKITILKYSYPC